VVSLLQAGRAPSTVATRLGAVAHAHRAAGHTLDRRQASELITAAKRETGFRQRGMLPLTVEQARRISADLATPGGKRSLGVAIRDRAIFLLGLASGMRRSELASLQLSDLERSAAGLLVTIRRSKTDQEGRGRRVGIPPGADLELCPCRAVAAWLAVRGDGPGPLFIAWCFRSDAAASPVRAVGDDAVYYRLKSALKRVGVDPTGYGAHSLRSGMVTAAAAAGASVPAIMARTGHRSTAMVERYTRGADPFAFDPLRGVL
jgi:integrase